MLKDNEVALAKWFLGEDRTNAALAAVGDESLNVFVDPDTTKDGVFEGHIPFFLPFSKIHAKIVEEAENIKRTSLWAGQSNYKLDLPLMDLSNFIVANCWPGNISNLMNVTMIRQERLDSLINRANLIKEFLEGVPADPAVLENYDRDFALKHKLPVFLLHTTNFPTTALRSPIVDAGKVTVQKLRDFALAVFQYYVPSIVFVGIATPFLYNPESEMPFTRK